jgi:tungstate transport system ATP-binding protein
MINNILEIKNLAVYRGKRQVLNIQNLDIQTGELVALVGPNGAGKSTLLRTINSLQTFQGQVKVLGNDINTSSVSEVQREMAMVFQETLLKSGTVYDNIAIGLKFRRIPDNEIQERIKESTEMLRCTHLLPRSSRALSGGERQRVGIARALVTKPKLLLLDEPFAALDLLIRREMIITLRRIAKEYGITVILVTHAFSEALYFADRVVALQEGRLIQDSTPYEMLRRPVNEGLALLVGIENMVPCSVVSTTDGNKIRLSNGVEFSSIYLGENPKLCCISSDCFMLESEAEGRDDVLRLSVEIKDLRPAKGGSEFHVDWKGLSLTVHLPLHGSENIDKGSSNLNLALPFDLIHFI